MRLGLLGDIHGNALALKVVLSAMTRVGVEELLITGDLIGYYFEPGRVLDMLDPWKKYIVRGNHEDMLIKAQADLSELKTIESRYGSGVGMALENLSTAQIKFLSNLPHPLTVTVDGHEILLSHGSPWDNDDYVYPDADRSKLERCHQPGFVAIIMGHTHYPMVKKLGNTFLINPGSVGQPRDRNPKASWALFDTDSMTVTLKRVEYDYRAMARQARERHPELPYLSDVLIRQ